MKFVISLLAAFVLIVAGVPALKVNAQDISNSPSSHPFGTLSEGSTAETGLTKFTITNNSAFSVNITISGTDMNGGGVTWELSDTATPDTDRYGLMAGLEGESYNITVRKTSPFNTLVSELKESGGTQKWGLKLLAPTEFTDGALKSGTVTLTATQP